MSDMRTAKTLSITLPPELLTKAQEFASREHRTMSELMREALRRYMAESRAVDRESWRELMEYGQARAGKAGETGVKRAVPDTNVLVSAFVFKGLPASLMDVAADEIFKPVTSQTLLDEFDEILQRKFHWPVSRRDAVLRKLQIICDVVSASNSLHVIKADPDDDRVLECAIAGRADYIISGDKHLLNLGSYNGIAIVTVRQFMDILNPPA
jgi:putative PIN family toxin of toxin-antitoxin system